MKRPAIIVTAAMLFVTFQALAQTNNPAPPDWITTTNKPCKVWNPEPQPNESVTWSGPCMDGFASGRGILLWTENGKPDVVYEGEYANGKRNGHGILITPDGKHIEGQWVNDRLLTAAGDAI